MAILKLAGFLRPSRNQLLHKRLPGEGVRDSIWQHAINTLAGFSTVRQNIVADGKLTGRVFAPYSVFKGKAALSAEPRLPTFSKLDSGGVKLNRRGVIMLTFWPSVGERKYDWEKRQLFALSATEVGSLISIGTRDSCEFFHDPSMLSSNAGQVRKSLSFKPNADGSGYFVSLSVVNNNLKTNDRFTVPVTTAEFAVMRTAFSFALPHIMGWDRFTNQPSESISQSPSKVVPQLMETEWDR
ncbi:single-stranded DNA-binding protein WHY2, mitochondrial isoform X3 [Nicotiana tabacum]|uniref:Single-stranded DNA-bindig protein WHY2, mitochondrial isoform X3 n=1 Tax=Nicotiana tabacum TaxID=4097 RepID=A0A1S4D4J1_TOBAC|nr:single-stranded DNA-binding protein WHY2, mitochondrial isoform X3 [Nicotiana tomentosiformis]XP_016508345.1 PREDICTED: single-stranded DNA-bindig protein WHY2, mitochondrial-like isoform X3 [Nicotiana tabacum]